ncbi:MAG: glycosyltransferase involved in cell wall biosynthesis [Crocinitomix sp.]|jgi:glycosyltransferase involved in cell wall biosynthesis
MLDTKPILIIAPCYNEEVGIKSFLNSLEPVCEGSRSNFEVVIVDDGSTDGTAKILEKFEFEGANISLTILRLDFNAGHQEAIFQGLIYAKSTEADKCVILDSDGQDDVALIPKMIAFDDCDVVHILRKKRKESLLFRFSYKIYKIIFKIITGKSIHFGNFCMINRSVVNRAAGTGFVHFPAFLSTFVQRKKYLTADRKQREAGKSKMKFTDLLNHAIKSFIQYSEKLLMVCLWLFIGLAIALVLFAAYVLYEKLFTDKAILGWASTIILGLFNGALIALSTFVIGTQLLKNSHGQNIKFNATIIKKERQN